jgi:hypothetical protein
VEPWEELPLLVGPGLPFVVVVLLVVPLLLPTDVVPGGAVLLDEAGVDVDDVVGVGVEGTTGEEGWETVGAAVGEATGVEMEDGTVGGMIGVVVDCAERRCGANARRTKQAHRKTSNREDILPHQRKKNWERCGEVGLIVETQNGARKHRSCFQAETGRAHGNLFPMGDLFSICFPRPPIANQSMHAEAAS